MDLKTLYIVDRKDWRQWLIENFETEKEIWLIYPRKASGKKRISYNDAVEEALCFGWIDSIVKSFDENSSIQRFSPRDPKSTYSQQNKERLKWLLKQNMVHSSIIDKVTKTASEEFIFPSDIIEAIKMDETVWENYSAFSDSYKRIRIAYIESARKRPDEFKKRLNNFIKKTKENNQIGYGGIEKYY